MISAAYPIGVAYQIMIRSTNYSIIKKNGSGRMGEDTRKDKVVVEGLTKRFGDLLVLNDINFTVKQG